MELEINGRFVEANTNFKVGEVIATITPPLDEDYWLFRVAVSKQQAVVGFPKFSTIGIGFQYEEDWNTNLPYQCDTEEIYEHIEHNRGDPRISKEVCIRAIGLIQEAATEYMR